MRPTTSALRISVSLWTDMQVPRGARSGSKGPRAPGGKRGADGADAGDAPAGKRARSGSHISADATVCPPPAAQAAVLLAVGHVPWTA